jgi:hypothetical protein
MAIDPNVIAALVGGSSAGAKTSTAVGSSTGIDWNKAKANQPGAWNLGQSIIDILSTVNYSMAGITRKYGENVAAIQRGDLGGLADLLNPISVISAAGKGISERRTFAPNLVDLGVDKNVAVWLGLALDIGLDPTTYISGGTIAGVKGAAAGVKLASAANKANSVVVRSAAEAAANNLPDISRAYIPSDVPLTQGQKLGNYLTGILRGHEYSTSVRSAEVLNKKLAKKITKDTNKEVRAGITKNVDLANEFIDGIEGYAKSNSVSVADNLAVIKRQELMDAISRNPAIAERYSKKFAKYQKAAESAENTKAAEFLKDSNKVSEAMMDSIRATDSTPAAARELSTLVKPIEAEKLENAILAEKTINPIDYVEILEKGKIAKGSSKGSRVKDSYSILADELVKLSSKVNDPATRKRMSNFEGTREELVEYMANQLSAGKLKLSPYRTEVIAKALGVSADPQQSQVDLITKTTLSFTTDFKKATEKQIAETANQLPRAVESKFINATTENTAALSGAVKSTQVGNELESTMGLETEISNLASDILNNNFLGVPQTTTRTAEELSTAANELRRPSAQELADDIDYIETSEYTSSRRNVIVPLQSFAPAVAAKAEKLANELGVKAEDLLYKAADDDSVILNNPNFLLSKDALRLDYINSEARFTINDEIWKNVLSNTGKKGRTAADLVDEEARAGRAIDNIFRLFSVPVKTVENLPMQLRRDGKKNVGEKLSDNFLPAESHVTYSDIARAAVDSGKANIIGALRYPGAKYQNVMPSNFEYAFLKIQQLQQSGKAIVRGSDEWEEVKRAFNEKYEFNYERGLKGDNVPVDELFIQARHLSPTPIPKGKQAGKTPSVIPGLEAKTDNVLQLMVDLTPQLEKVHSVRAAAVVAVSVSDEMPAVQEIMSGLIQTAGLREDFIRGMGKLASAGGNALRAGSDEIPGWDSLAVSITNLMVKGTKGAKLFNNPKLASSVRDMMINTVMKNLFGGSGAKTLAALEASDPMRAAILQSSLVSLSSDLRDKLLIKINLENAIGVTKPSTKLTTEATRKGMNARNSAAEVQASKAGAFVPAAVNGQNSMAVTMMTSGKKATDTSSNLPNSWAGNVDPEVAGFENVASVMLTEVGNLKFSEKILKTFSASYKIGRGAQNVVGGITTWNFNSVGLYRNSLTSIFLKHGKNTAAINSGFKILQRYGKEMSEAVENNVKGPSLDDWLIAQKVSGASADIARDMMVAVNALFGEMGSAADTVKLPFFSEELNVMFGMDDFWKKGSGKGFTLPPKMSPEGIKYSWADAELDGNINALELLSGYASAIHAVKTKIGIGATYSRLFGKTAQEIADEGLDITKFVKIDQADEFGKYLNPNSYFDAEQIEKMRYVKDYLMYKKSFGKNMQKVVDFSDMITSFLKASHTTWRPGHHVTSIVGETSMNLMAGVTNPKYYYHSGRLLKNLDPVNNKGDENAFKAYAQVASPKGMQISAEKFDGIGYVSSKTLKKTVVTDEAIMAAAERNQVLTRAGLGTVEDLDLRGAGNFSNGVFGGAARVNNNLAKFSSTRDNFFRLSHFIHELENGGIYSSFEEAAAAAARRVAEWHPTVGGLSAFERKYMRRAVFFYTWQRLAATKVFELALERPGIVTIPPKIQYAFAEANGFNPESFGDPWDPNGVYASWNTDSVYGPQFQGPEGKSDAWGFSPAIPTLDILNTLVGAYTIQPGQSGLDAVLSGTQNLAGQNLSPLPKWFAELTTGNRVGIGGDIRNPIEYAIDQVGGINTLSKVTGIGREPDDGVTPSEKAQKDTRLLANYVLGQKLQDYSTDQSMKQWKRDQALMLQRLTGQE